MSNIMYNLILQLFADETTLNANKTSASGMSPTMKTFYDTSLLENARAELIFNQFGDKQKIHGNKCEWRKFNTFPKALTPITEGVTPTGQAFGMTKIEGTTSQHGDYTTITDRLEYEAYDPIIQGCTEEMGASAGATMDTLTRNVLIAGNSVMYCPKKDGTVISKRDTLTADCVLTPAVVKKAVTWLKKNKAPKINGSYVCLIHPSVAHDLTESDEWKEYHKYNDTAPIFKGEIGELHGCRFVESTECKIHAHNKLGIATYDTLFLGAKAFGIIEPENESMHMIIKDKSEIGGPLELYSTVGYKFSHGAKILYEERILRVESGSSYSSVDEEN